MDLLLVTIPVEKIKDWPSFHQVFQDTLGFPAFYGRNMNAWIDCMTYVDSPETGMTSVNVQPGQMLGLQIEDPFNFRRRCPEQYDAMIECSAFVNFRRCEVGEAPS